MLIDSIMGTIDHIYCDNTFHVITEQNHRRNTIVRHFVQNNLTVEQIIFHANSNNQTELVRKLKLNSGMRRSIMEPK